LGIKAFSAAVLGGIGNCVVPCWAVCCWAYGELRPGLVRHQWRDVVAFVLLVSGAAVPADRHTR